MHKLRTDTMNETGAVPGESASTGGTVPLCRLHTFPWSVLLLFPEPLAISPHAAAAGIWAVYRLQAGCGEGVLSNLCPQPRPCGCAAAELGAELAMIFAPKFFRET